MYNLHMKPCKNCGGAKKSGEPGAKLCPECRELKSLKSPVMPEGHKIDLTRSCIRGEKIHKNGYSRHREIWIEHYGIPPPGFDVMHMCNNRWCDELYHFKLGTRSENLRMRTCYAAATGGRANAGRQKHPGFGELCRQAQYTLNLRRCTCGMVTNAGSMARHQSAPSGRGHYMLALL